MQQRNASSPLAIKMTSGVPSPPCTVYKPFMTPSLEVPGWLGMPCREKAMTDGRGMPSGFFPFALSTAACKHRHDIKTSTDPVGLAGSLEGQFRHNVYPNTCHIAAHFCAGSSTYAHTRIVSKPAQNLCLNIRLLEIRDVASCRLQQPHCPHKGAVSQGQRDPKLSLCRACKLQAS